MMTVSSGSDIMCGDGLMEASVGGGVPGLAEQIGHIEELVTRLVTRTEEAARRRLGVSRRTSSMGTLRRGS